MSRQYIERHRLLGSELIRLISTGIETYITKLRFTVRTLVLETFPHDFDSFEFFRVALGNRFRYLFDQMSIPDLNLALVLLVLDKLLVVFLVFQLLDRCLHAHEVIGELAS